MVEPETAWSDDDEKSVKNKFNKTQTNIFNHNSVKSSSIDLNEKLLDKKE